MEVDYVLFGLLLVIFVGIGFFFVIKDRKYNNIKIFLMVGGEMSFFLVVFFFLVSFMFVIILFGIFVEMYNYMMIYWWIGLGYFFVIFGVVYVYMLVFYWFCVISLYEVYVLC